MEIHSSDLGAADEGSDKYCPAVIRLEYCRQGIRAYS